jgi:hypothetical protein
MIPTSASGHPDRDLVFIGADWKDDDPPAESVQKTQSMIQV